MNSFVNIISGSKMSAVSGLASVILHQSAPQTPNSSMESVATAAFIDHNAMQPQDMFLR